MNVSLDLEWTGGITPTAGEHDVEVFVTATDELENVINITVEGEQATVMAWLFDEYCDNDFAQFKEAMHWLVPADFKAIATV